MRRLGLLLVAMLALAAWAVAAQPALKIIFVDVEGGQSTLIVTPTGQSLLIDTGWGGFQNRDADRIAAAARSAGLKKIDYVLLTHYHLDHASGVPQLVATFPVGTFIDHGPLEEKGGATQRAWQAYQDVLATGRYGHLTPKPGDVLPLTGVTATVVSSNGVVLDHNLAGGGAANPACSIADTWPTDTSENAYSLGVLVQYGQFKFLDVGDLTWDKDRQLVCPDNRIGDVSVFLLANHGMTPTSSHALAYGIHPEVVVVDNGARKGGAAPGLDMVKATPGLKALWQLHYADASGASNTGAAHIVNVQGPDTGLPLELTAQSSGAFSLYNPRTKATARYAARRR
jgi:beta-lactamase superfamily II metal-dependent hydrolase